MRRPQVFPAIKGIWVKSRYTDIAYEVIAFKFKQNKDHLKIRQYKIKNQGRYEWWEASRFQLLTTFNVNSNEVVTIGTDNSRIERDVENNYFDDKIVYLR